MGSRLSRCLYVSGVAIAVDVVVAVAAFVVVAVVSCGAVERPKAVRTWWAYVGFHVLTSKCASHHSSAHFFRVATSKSV